MDPRATDAAPVQELQSADAACSGKREGELVADDWARAALEKLLRDIPPPDDMPIPVEPVKDPIEAARLKAIADYSAELEAQRHRAEDAHTAELRRIAKARGIPELHARHVVDHEPEDCDALEQVRRFVSGPETLLVLAGGVGTRKSGSAAWSLTQKPGRFVAADELSDLAAAKDPDGQREWRQLKRTDLLVVDDLGGEYLDDKGWFARVLNALVDRRYSECLKTIFTTNLDVDGFKRRYGERVADRIREVGAFYVIGGSSIRVRQ